MPSLSEYEVKQAQQVIDRATSGVYELRDLYGDDWSNVVSPTSFGAKFKNAVKSGQLKKIRHHNLKSNNHHEYEILD